MELAGLGSLGLSALGVDASDPAPEPDDAALGDSLDGPDPTPGFDDPSLFEAALAINCTGPHTRFSATRSALLQQLLGSGLAQPDAMDMGIRVDPDFTVIGRDGRRSSVLLALGPLLRGTLWESIAVPELRGQALRVAQTLLDARATAEAEEAVIEYQI